MSPARIQLGAVFLVVFAAGCARPTKPQLVPIVNEFTCGTVEVRSVQASDGSEDEHIDMVAICSKAHRARPKGDAE
jgi:hypothetical protein